MVFMYACVGPMGVTLQYYSGPIAIKYHCRWTTVILSGCTIDI